MSDMPIPWGDGETVLALPDHWSLEQVAEPALRAADDEWPQRMAVALNQPASGLPLSKLLAARRDARIVIIVEDLTRHSPLEQMLDVLMREIRFAGVPLENVQVVFATGMHPALTREQAVEKIGPLAEQIRWRSNPWTQPDRFERLGTVQGTNVLVEAGVAAADLRIIISSVSPHLQAGFGGGYKMIFPGCAGLETIRGLHRKGIGRRFRQLVGMPGESNPMRRGIDRAGRLLDAHHGTTFAVQYLLDETNLPVSIAAGQTLPTQRMLAKQCSVACGVVTAAPADVLLVNAHPRDFDLWQSFKCIVNTLWAARSGGILICETECPAGLHDMSPPKWPLSPAWTRRVIRWLGGNSISDLLTRFVPRLSGDAEFFVRLAMQTIQRNTIFMVSRTLHEQTGGRFPGMEIFPDLQSAVDQADRLLGQGAQRVLAFPSGGITFPIPKRSAAERMASH